MSTTRKTGNATLRLTYRDRGYRGDYSAVNGSYDVNVSAGRRRKKIIVNAPASMSTAVDSKKAYDEAARAAVSFALDEGMDLDPIYDNSGVVAFESTRRRKS